MKLNKHKFNAKPAEEDGIRFGSTKERDYYRELKLRQRAKEIIFFLRQVPFHLPGGVIYRLDFMEFHSDGTVHCTEVKGFQTPEWKIKKKLVESLYPIEIEVV